MIEQTVRDRFRDAVAGEPPLGFDPDEVVDRAIRRGRRRKAVWAIAAATCVETAGVWALASAPGEGSDQVAAGGGDPDSVLDMASALARHRVLGRMLPRWELAPD